MTVACPRAVEIADRVEAFVRNVVAPYEKDPRAGSHGPSEELVAELGAAREALVPAGRIGTGDDVAQAVVYLTSEGASYVTGQALVVDGGVSDHMLVMIPGRPGK